MACGCNKSALDTFVVQSSSGEKVEVQGEVQARMQAAKFGGGASWKKK